jgi:hypothetical protein
MTLAGIAGHLDQLGYTGRRIDEWGGYVVFRVQGVHGIHTAYLAPRGGLVQLQIPHLIEVPDGDPRLPRLHAVVSELNWMNRLGHYAWDAHDGEVRYAYSFVAGDGLSHRVFAAALTLALRTVDHDLPALRAVEGAVGTGVPERPKGNRERKP